MSKSTQINKKTIAKIPTRGNDVTTLGANSVAESNLQDLSVGTNKIKTGAVNEDKLATGLIPYINKHSRNYIINGDMKMFQRGAVSLGSGTVSGYSLDRWIGTKSTTSVNTITQSVTAPTNIAASEGLGRVYTASLLMQVSTADATIAASDYFTINQYVEGLRYAEMATKPFTLSFWVMASKTGTFCVAFQNSGTDRSYVAEYTILAPDTWEYKTITVAAPPTAGSWNYDTGIGLRVMFVQASGTTFQTTAGSWQTGNFLSTNNQVNNVSATSDYFRLTGVMLNEGSINMPFHYAAINADEEQNICYRYFEKSYELATAPGTNTIVAREVAADQAQTTTSTGGAKVKFKVRKRGTPTVTAYATNGTAGQWQYSVGTGVTQAAITLYEQCTSSFGIYFNATAAGLTVNAAVLQIGHWTADSELT